MSASGCTFYKRAATNVATSSRIADGTFNALVNVHSSVKQIRSKDGIFGLTPTNEDLHDEFEDV
jgi:hypothetical protein